MRIVYIGNFKGKDDEGFTKISMMFYNFFSKKNYVLKFNTNECLRYKTFLKIFRFNPDIIHYLSGPTIRSFFILRLFKFIFRNDIKYIVSATRPFFSGITTKFISIFKPDLVFGQSEKWNSLFKKNRIDTIFVPNPICLNKFKKLRDSQKKLRIKYELPIDKKLLLHIGHIKRNRNIELLADLQERVSKRNYQVIIVSSTHFYPEPEPFQKLIDSGCIILNYYIENIAEIYNACDYYIFPVLGLQQDFYPKSLKQVGVIDMPLSVLEALSCELPVISTPIDSVKFLIKNIDSSLSPVKWFNGDVESLIKILEKMESQNVYDFMTVKQQISSKNVFNNVEKIYMDIIK